MSAADLLADLTRHGIRLEADGDRLRYHPRSALTPDMFVRLRDRKAELLALLASPPAVAPTPACKLPTVHPDYADVWDGPNWYHPVQLTLPDSAGH